MSANTTPKRAAKTAKPILPAPSSPLNLAASPSFSLTKMTWDAANDRKLFLLIFGRTVTPAEYPQLSKVFPGSSVGSIRNRITALRAEARKMQEGLGYEVGAGAAAKKVAAATPKKRGAVVVKREADAMDMDEEDEDEDIVRDPSKRIKAAVRKPQAKKDSNLRKKGRGGAGSSLLHHGSSDSEDELALMGEDKVKRRPVPAGVPYMVVGESVIRDPRTGDAIVDDEGDEDEV
ncbi:hypothetical protein J4E85_011111 [Alternaria conjuncta]|uniref:uncharacterized protein n=1 Tax=Alternaria conjuncta TaxID=181017 RepID=UPI002221130A|nr:uncharacterized protein J4E85_011111 [Alternaria conjuncta]KAI4605375.1 hypothetical protein J4E80_010638 [Alternaria sp. BMP 0032]KAI4912177.1 hypothetical protein J4E85_011111 [Alternaria conjuncta]